MLAAWNLATNFDATLPRRHEGIRRLQGGTITLGPASLSFPELAQALTKAGMPTEAAPTLADRGAFVRLKGRSPEAVRSVLGEALGVSFQAQGTGWRMVVDPAAKERERLFLAQYRRQAIEKAREWAKTQDTLVGGRSYAILDRDVQGASKAFEKLVEPPDAATKAGLRRLFALSTLLNPAAWTGVQAFRDAAVVGAAIDGSAATVTTPLTQVESVLGLPLPAFGSSPPKAIQTTLRFSPATGFLASDASGVVDDGPRELSPYPFHALVGPYTTSGTGGRAETRVEGVTLVETFNRMGQAAGDYLRSFEPRPDLPATPTATGPVPATLSSVLEKVDVEAVMELSPRFEGLPVRQMPSTVSLRDALAIVPYPTVAGPTGAPAWLVELSRSEDRSSVVARARTFPWRVRARDGMFEIVDPLAFLDRTQWMSPVPALRVERILSGLAPDAPTDLGGTPLPDWSRLETIASALGTGNGLYGGYRGIRLEAYASLIPIARLVAAVPDKAALWRDARRTEGVEVPVNGGTLSLQASLWGAEYGFARPVLRVTARWTGPKGEVVFGEGTLDPRGIL